MNPALRASAAHVFVDALEAISLSKDDTHHLFRVLRLRDGETVTVSDGRGEWRACTVTGNGLVPTGDVMVESAAPSITIAAAIPKGDRVEWMVQKLTELGVSEIVFMHCDRSVVRWKGDRGANQLDRLTRVAREAAMQSRRVWLPALRGPVEFAEAAAFPGAVIADPDGDAAGTATVVLIGPEGGFADAERQLCPLSIRLGPGILRVETAAVAAAAILGRDGR
ncbi:MAG: RsmE family RNA methyltransferase [Ilumatobacteraceae bacterium]